MRFFCHPYKVFPSVCSMGFPARFYACGAISFPHFSVSRCKKGEHRGALPFSFQPEGLFDAGHFVARIDDGLGQRSVIRQRALDDGIAAIVEAYLRLDAEGF